jgi:hypothetical protein
MKGGKREGAGKPKGTKDYKKITSFFTPEEIEQLVKDAKAMAKKDPLMMKFLIEQLFGKAKQPLVGEDGEPIKISVVQYGNTNTIQLPTEGLSTTIIAGN